MIWTRFAATCAMAAAMLTLAGCASKEPMDYLPEGTAYVAVNMAEVRSDAGTKRLLDVMEKLDQTEVRADSAAERLYFSFSGVPPQTSIYGVMIGRNGFAEQALADLKKAGGTEAKLNGRRAVVGEKFSLSPVNENAVLFFHGESELAHMVNTSKRKNPAAAQTALFRSTRDLAADHGIAMTLNPGPLLAMAEPQLNMLSMMSPKGVEALKQSDSLAVTLDWDEQPALRAALSAPTESREDLATFLNMLLGQVKGRLPQQGSGAAAGATAMWVNLLQELKVQAAEEGVELTLALPKEKSEEFLSRMEATAANLPQDPAERQKAIQQALSGANP